MTIVYDNNIIIILHIMCTLRTYICFSLLFLLVSTISIQNHSADVLINVKAELKKNRIA